MARVLQIEVVSQHRRLWSGTGSQVVVPAADGSLGILPGRQPLLAVLGRGTVQVATDGGRRAVDVDGGFVSVDSDFVTVVTGDGSLRG